MQNAIGRSEIAIGRKCQSGRPDGNDAYLGTQFSIGQNVATFRDRETGERNKTGMIQACSAWQVETVSVNLKTTRASKDRGFQNQRSARCGVSLYVHRSFEGPLQWQIPPDESSKERDELDEGRSYLATLPCEKKSLLLKLAGSCYRFAGPASSALFFLFQIFLYSGNCNQS